MSDTLPALSDPPAKNTTRSHTARKHTARRLIASLVVGLLALGIGLVAVGQGSNTAEVTMVLDQAEVTWPYHDAVRQSAIGRLESDPEAQQIADAQAGAGATIDGTLLTGQSHFVFSVDGDNSSDAAAAVDALVAWLVEENLAEQREPLAAELDLLAQKQDELQRAVDAFTTSASADTAPANDTASANETPAANETALAEARYLEEASLLASYERQGAEVLTDLELIRPQFWATAPAAPVSNPLRPILTALVAVLAAFVTFSVLQPPAADNEPRE